MYTLHNAHMNKNMELRMKWGVILYFNGYLPLAMQIFREYVMKDMKSTVSHEYYCGLACCLFFELGICLLICFYVFFKLIITVFLLFVFCINRTIKRIMGITKKG